MEQEISQAARKFLKWQELSPIGLSVDEMRERNEKELITVIESVVELQLSKVVISS